MSVDKQILDYFLLKALAELGDESSDGDVDGAQLFDRFRASYHAAKDLANPKVGTRLLGLEADGFLTLHGYPARNQLEAAVLNESGPVVMVRITTQGEQALTLPPGRFREVIRPQAQRNVYFQGPVSAQNLATGDYSSQTATINLTLGDLLAAVDKAIEENPVLTTEQKLEAKSRSEKIKENLPHAAQICTVSGTLVKMIQSAMGWIG